MRWLPTWMPRRQVRGPFCGRQLLAAGWTLLAAAACREPLALRTTLPLVPPGEASLALRAHCSLCHFDVAMLVEGSVHAQAEVSCASCHGASRGHREAENNAVPPEVHFRGEAAGRIEELCGACHPDLPAATRSRGHPDAATEAPETGGSCTGCHDPHG